MSAGDAADVIIVGSGPAGVSVAWPLIEAGVKVLMIDASGDQAPPAAPTGTIGEFRRAPERWKMRFGSGLAGLISGGDLSPKLNTPLAHFVLKDFQTAQRLDTDGFHAFGSLARGGLSSIWGGMTPQFEAADLADYPITLNDLRPSYRRVMSRIGMSGPGAEVQGPPLTVAAQRLIDRFERKTSDQFVLERATNAILMEDRGERQGCASCGLCLWGCARKSIYSAAYELPQLRSAPNFTYRSHARVKAVVEDGAGHSIVLESGERLSARRVIMAAGTVATTSLVVGRLGLWDKEIKLLTNPVAAAAFLQPSLVGSSLPERSFSLAQLRWEVSVDGSEPVGGAIYGGDTLPITEVASRIPLSRPTALRVSRALAPALLLSTIYLPGSASDNTMRVGRDRVEITGRISDRARQTFRQAYGKLARSMRTLGAWPVPRSFTVSEAGADAHYAGTIPMGSAGSLSCSAFGEVTGCDGLYVADGAALSSLPSKHCTLTIMANADRIGRHMAAVALAPAMA